MSVFTFFNEVCYCSDPFDALIRETHCTITMTIPSADGYRLHRMVHVISDN